MSLDYPDHLGSFLLKLGDRLATGHRVYGSASFARTPYELLEELEQELLDVAGWGYITFAKVQDMKRKLCRKCGGPIIRLRDEPKREDGLCSPCASGVNMKPVENKGEPKP